VSTTQERLAAALSDRYRIERELGAGGMATVYLAEDLKHKRKVALKVLKPELAAVLGAERFVVEITTTASLSHPHILPLFDSGEADGFLFYVMPFVDGETLRDRLNRETQLSVEEAVRITREVADALHYAHTNGVIHRDIKPENILLQGGRPMVADFGIALAVSAAAGGRMTETGLSLGTPHYMSPEQATAEKEITGRSDIYSLASVCYEMLTGNPPHVGSSAQQIIMKIITEQPQAVTTHRKAVPANVAAAVGKALEKLPADRFESAEKFAEALRDPGFATQLTAAGTAGATGGRSGRFVTVAAALAPVLLVAALWGWLRPPPAQAPQVPTRTQLTGLDFLETGVGGWQLAISPDGRWIVARNAPDLYIRAADEMSWRLLSNTTGATNPSFSPDGQFVLFNAAGQILKVAITGGTALPIAEGSSAHWGTDETIVFTRGNGLYKVSAAGGEPTLLFDATAGAGGVTEVAWPHLLPNGRAVIFGTSGDASSSRIALLDLETEEVRILVASGNQPTYVPTGHIIYGLDEQSLMGVPFDLTSLKVTGTPVTLLPELTVYRGGASQYAVSASGAIVYDRATDNMTAAALRLADVTLGGEVTPLPLAAGILGVPRFSPDGRKIAYEDASALRVYDRLTGANPAIGEDAILRRAPAWTSAGDRLAFREGPRTSAVTMFWPTDGRGPTTRLGDGVGGALLDFAPGDTLSVAYGPRWGLNPDLYVARIGEGGASYEPLLAADWNEAGGDLSPDGRWLAYHSNESGENRVYVHSFPALTVRHEISPGPGTEPAWSPDGRRIYYRSGTGFYAVDVTTTPTFVARPPRLLFDNPRLAIPDGPGYTRNWDVRPDGTGFVMVLDEAQKEAGGTTMLDRRLTDVVLVVNWFEELRARMGKQGGR